MENKVAVRQPEFSLAEMERLSASFAKSLFFADARDAAQALVKIQAGRELGLPPVYSMTKIFFVQGRLTLSAEAMGALIKSSKDFDYHVDILDNEKCTITFYKKGLPEYVSTFTLEDAKRAELTGKEHSNWAKWPRPMLMSKALSQGARIVCPHIISGAYTPEDFGIETDDEGYITQPQRVSVEGTAKDITGKAEPPNQPSPGIRADMQAMVDKADGKPAELKPDATTTSQGGQGAASETKQVETVVGDSIGNVARRAMAKEKDKVYTDPETIRTVGDFFTAVKKDFNLMPEFALREINKKSRTDITDPKAEYLIVAATFKRAP